MSLRCAVLGALFLAALNGCGAKQFPTATLEGSVTVDNEPLPTGTVSFTPLDQPGATATTPVKDGRYRLANAPIGRIRVTFHAVQGTGKMVHDPGTDQEYEETINLVPATYQSKGLTIEVEEGQAQKDFALESAADASVARQPIAE